MHHEDFTHAIPFFFLKLKMVSSDRVKRKLPSLLLDGEIGTKKNNECYMKKRYQLTRFKRNNPQEYEFLLNRLIVVLNELDKQRVKH